MIAPDPNKAGIWPSSSERLRLQPSGAPARKCVNFPGPERSQHLLQAAGRIGGARAIGPSPVGMAKPVQVLQRDSDVSDIANIAVIAAIDAQERARRTAGTV